MRDDSGQGCCENALDRELSRMRERQPGVGDAHPSQAAAPARPSDSEQQHDDISISVSEFRREIADSLRTGMTLPQDIFDESDVLLLAAGSRVTSRFLDLLRKRHIKRIRLRYAQPRDSATPIDNTGEANDDLTTSQSRRLDEQMAEELQRPVDFRSMKAWRRPRVSTEDLKDTAHQGVKRHVATSAAVTSLCRSLDAGREVSSTELKRCVTHFGDMAAVDFDLLPLIVAMQQSGDEYLYDHCVNVALLSMAISLQLGLDRKRITEIGLGGMLHDIGMLRVPVSIRLATGALDDREWHEIHRHPLHTLEMLGNLRGIPQGVRFIAYQAHERIDGGGYPRHRCGRQLHKFARIVSIADVYTAMTRERPYRSAMPPYEAVKTILTEGAANRFDRALVRALLDTISLFPIGSRVELSTGCPATVLRANPGLHTRPVVEELTADGCPTGYIIDLSHEKTTHVAAVT